MRLVSGVADRDRFAACMTHRLERGLLAVMSPLAYGHAEDADLARHRPNLAERANALAGLYLFQIEGLIRARVRAREKGIVDVPSMVHEAWLRWLQLHGRRAGIVVPMDGWLVSEFPEALLADDIELMDRIAGTEALGMPISIEFGIAVPNEFHIPVEVFSMSVGAPPFSAEIGELFGFHFVSELVDVPTIYGSAGNSRAAVRDIADRLLADLVADLTGSRVAAQVEYPG